MKSGLFGIAFFMLWLIVSAAHATNGYFTHGLGVKNKALAGAGSASPEEAISTALNPASAVVVGERFEVGVAIFAPRRSYSVSTSQADGKGGAFSLGPNSLESDNKFFPIPYIGKIWELEENSAIALNFYGRGGMNTEFAGGSATFDPDGPGPAGPTVFSGTFGSGTTGVDLAQAFLDLTYARRSGSLSWGVSAVLAVQSFEAKGLGNFAGLTETFARSGGREQPRHLTNNGHDLSFGYGYKLGFIWDVSERVNLAAAYQGRIMMQEFDRYADLFADAGGFDIPANAQIGASWIATDKLTLHFDVEHTWYSEVGSVGHSMSNIEECPTAGLGGTDAEACLGGDDGAGFGWADSTVYKLGAQWHMAATPRWTWRAGLSQADHPVDGSDSLFNILAPAVVERHFTFGGSRSRIRGGEYSFSLMYAPESTSRGANAFDPTQTIELKMHQFELEIGFSF